MSVDEFSTVFHSDRSIVDEGNAALSAVGVARELKVKWMGLVEFIKGVGLVNK